MGEIKINDQFLVDEEKTLGRGSFATVYEAKDEKENGKLIAAKKVDLQHLTPWLRKMAIREVQVLERIPKHPNLISYISHWQEANYLWIFMDKCNGVTLDEFCERNTLSLEDKYSVMIAIMEALHYIHNLDTPVVHRDLKGENILICLDKGIPQPKLADFGSAKISQIQGDLVTFAGTPRFMSPELFEVWDHRADDSPRITYDEKVDIFSIGLIFSDFRNVVLRKLQSIMVGEGPGEKSLGQALYDTNGSQSHSIRVSKFDDSQEEQMFKKLIISMLQFEPKNRPTSKEVLRTLKEIYGYLSSSKDLVQKLDFVDYYKDKLSLNDLLISTLSDKELPHNLQNIGKIMLRDYICSSYEARDTFISELRSRSSMSVREKRKSLRKQSKKEDPDSVINIHPLDVFVVIFECCDARLKQLLVTKMFQSRLAIPICVPQEMNSDPAISLWPLLNVIMSWHTNRKETENSGTKETTSQTCIFVDHPMHIVSFLRIGRPHLSKSQIMNSILYNGEHQPFCHHDIAGITNCHKIATGYVEGCCYLPSADEGATFKSEILFLNIRGNSFEVKPLTEKIIKISTAWVVVMDINDVPDIAASPLFKKMMHNGAIPLLTSSNVDKCEKLLDKYFDKMSPIPTYKDDMSMSDVIEWVNDAIVEALEISAAPKSVLQHSCNFAKDEYFLKINEISSKRGDVLDKPPDMSLADFKTVALPLHLDPWIRWSTLQKDLYRKITSSAESRIFYIAQEIQEKMDEQRQHQHKIIVDNPSSQVMYISNILKKEPSERFLYIFDIKRHLDKLSTEVTPVLQQKYIDLWTKYSCSRKSKDINGMTLTEKNMLELDVELVKSSLGFQHVLREIGQVYEAVDFKNTHLEFWKHLPNTVAQLITEGHQFEIMDGNIASVPLRWVKAVFNCVSHIVGRDKKVFVLAIVGIQSSGKSTLLNTMFGTEFNVSAGRCTRGVFAQLFPVTMMPFDFLLLLDTEGLRAPGQKDEMYHHDNELSTFIIGLADLTLVNMKGENTFEMCNVLQIVTHAFLRMKRVDGIRKQQCIFVHQNVSAVDASEKMVKDVQAFIDKLDLATREIADIESIPNIKCFTDIMDFDVKCDIHYLSDCWKGDPPMAPFNPKYCKKVFQLRQRVLTKARNSSIGTMDDIVDRIEDMWKAILSEDFVFNFSNTKALKAYLFLESKISEEKINLQQELDQKARQYMQTIRNCCEEKLELTLHEKVGELKNVSQTLSEKANKGISDFIETHTCKDYMICYHEQKIQELKLAIEAHKNRLADQITKSHHDRLEVLRHKNKQEIDEEVLKGKADYLIRSLSLSDKHLSDNEILEEFSMKWIDWVRVKKEEDPHQLKLLMEISILTKLKTLDIDIDEGLACLRGFSNLPMDLSVTESSISKEMFVKGNVKGNGRFFNLSKIRTDKTKNVARQTNALMSRVKELIDSRKLILREDWRKLILEIFNIFCKTFKLSQSSERSYVLTKTWMATFCAYAVSYVINTLHLKEKSHQISHDMEQSLLSAFHSNEKYLKPFLSKKADWWNNKGITKTLPDRMTLEDIKNFTPKNERKRTLEAVRSVMNVIDTELNKVCEKDYPFSPTDAVVISQFIKDQFQNHNNHQQVKLSQECIANCAVIAASRAIHKFEVMDFKYKIEYGLLAELDQFRVQMEVYVRNEVKSIEPSKTAVRMVFSILKSKIRKEVPVLIKRPFINHIHELIGYTKHDFIVTLMTDLAEQSQRTTGTHTDVFEKFMDYIYDPHSYATRWIKRKTGDLLFSKTNKMFASYAANQVKNICSTIISSAVHNSNVTCIKEWCEAFCERIQTTLPDVTIRDFRMIIAMKEIHMGKFQEFFVHEFPTVREAMIEEFHKTNESNVNWNGDDLYISIMNSLWGCTGRCPFCREPCKNTVENHKDRHECIEHRPHVVCGWQDMYGPKLGNCSLLVSNKSEIYHCGNTGCNCGDSSLLQYHMYNEYKTFLPRWHIREDPGYVETSKYWKWFVSTYHTQLIEKHDLVNLSVPNSWKNITVEVAKESLDRYKRTK